MAQALALVGRPRIYTTYIKLCPSPQCYVAGMMHSFCVFDRIDEVKQLSFLLTSMNSDLQCIMQTYVRLHLAEVDVDSWLQVIKYKV